jgi:very-short-patch-repair endonuclease
MQSSDAYADRFTRILPPIEHLMFSVRQDLLREGRVDLATALEGVQADPQTSSDYYPGWPGYWTMRLRLFVPSPHVALVAEERDTIRGILNHRMPPDVGYRVASVEVTRTIEVPSDDEEVKFPINQASLISVGLINHDGLRFRSPAEPPIYDALRRRNVAFCPNAPVVFGGRGAHHLMKREADFLVILPGGRCAVLEVNGAAYHQDSQAELERTRQFEGYGINVYPYPAKRCMQDPDSVVEEFLAAVEKDGRASAPG